MPKLVRSELVTISEIWLSAAKSLFADGQTVCAYHAAGIALECALKAQVARNTRAEEFPDKTLADKAWKHDPADLLRVAQLEKELDKPSNAGVKSNWQIVKNWSIETRYDVSRHEADVESLIRALDDPPDGVLVWLRKL